jgi:uncharacterized repeat protein (TIGR01451 family)
MNASGNFSYLPAAGFTGTDTFSYTITDKGLNGVAGDADDLTSVGTVTISVGAQKVWYVDNSYTGANGASDGRSTRPFTSITATNLNGPGGVGDVDGANDIIFLHTGTGATYTGGIGLEAGETLQGQGTALVVGGFNLVAAGTLPKISNAGGIAVNLSTDNKLLGFSANDAATSISGTSFNTLDVHNVTIANTTGAGLNLTTGSFVGGAQFNSISSAGGVHGIALTGVNSTGAAIDLGGNSGTGLTGATGGAFFVSGGNAVLSFGGPITNTAGHSVDISSHATGNITISTATLSDTGTGISITNNTSGTISFTGTAKIINTGVNTAVTYTGNGANLTFGGPGNVDIDTTTATAFNATGNTGSLTVTGTGNTIDTTTGSALAVVNTIIGASGLTFQHISAGTSTSGPTMGIDLDTTGSLGGLTVTGTGSTAGSGGTLQKSTHGVFARNTTGLSLSFMNIINNGLNQTVAGSASTAGGDLVTGNNLAAVANVTLFSATNVSLISDVITGSSQMGINGNAVNGLTITNSTVKNNGNESFESGIVLQNASGTISITGTDVRDNRARELHIADGGTITSTLTLTNSQFGHTAAGTGTAETQQGILLQLFGTSNTTINASALTISNNDGVGFTANGFQLNADNGGPIVNGSIQTTTFDNNAAHVLVNAAGTSTVTFDTLNSPSMTKAALQAINYTVLGGSTAITANLTGTIKGNVINNSGLPSANAHGIDINSGSTWAGQMHIRVEGNNVQGVAGGIIGTFDGNDTAGAATPTVNLRVVGNTVSNPVATASEEAIKLNAAVTSTHSKLTVGWDVGGGGALNNVISGHWANGASEASIFLRTRFTGVASITLPGYGGGAADDAAVQTYLAGRNSITAPGGTGVATLVTHSQTNPFTNGTVTTPLIFQPAPGDVNPATGGGSSPATPTPPPAIVVPPTQGGTPLVQPPVIVDDGILSQAELDSLVGAAIARWEATGLTPAQDALLHSVTFSVADLPGWYLGSASPGHITLDTNAAGNSWFIDATPNDDSEFAGSHATATGGAAGRIDALTTVLHELGHQLGLDDSYVSADSGNLMYGYIHQSERRLPTSHQADGATPHLVQGDLDFAVGPINIGSLPIGKSVQVVFTAQIVANPNASTISNQGTASSTQTGPVLTDGNAGTPGQQPTITQIALPEVNLAIGTTTSVAEDSGGNLVYTFTRQAPLTNSLTVNFTVSGGAIFTGNAASDTDYTQSGAATFTGTTGTVTFAANSNTATVTITPHADTATEPDESVILTLASGTGYSVATTGSTSGTGTILNDDTTVFVSGSPGSVAEDSGSSLTYTFKRNGLIANAMDVHLHLAGSATFPTDYGQVGATTYDGADAFLHFAPGSDTATIVLTPVSDSTVEPDETVQMTIVAGAGYNVDTELNSLTGTITNDDATVSVAITPPGSIAEDAAGVLTYTFTRVGFIANAATVNFTASGSATLNTDYGVNGASFIGLAGTVTFAPNSSTATVTVDPTADANGEPDETVIFTINAGTGYSPDVPPNDHATGTILNDDTSVSVAVTNSPLSEAATGGAHFTYTFTRTGDNAAPLTINFSAGGSASFANDYVLTGANSFSTASGLGTLTFAPGSSTASVSVTPTNDTLVEGDEQAVLFVNTGPGYGVGTSPAIGTISDNESATISFVKTTSAVPEGTTPHTVGVQLAMSSPEGTASLQNDFTVYVQDHTVPGVGHATGGGVDYTFNEQSVTFSPVDSAGTIKTVSADIVNDHISEGNEIFQLGLSATSGNLAPFAAAGPAPAVSIDLNPHTVTIVDNDIDVHLVANGPVGNVIAGSGAANVSFNFTVQNTGLTDATSLTLSELFNLPAGVTFDSSAPGGNSTFDGANWFIPTLAVNGTVTLTVNLTADHSTAGGANVSTNMTAVSADQDLVNTGDDFVMSSASIARQSDLQLSLDDAPDPVGSGGQLVYTITVHNAGPSDVAGASVTDLLPAGFTNATWTTSVNGTPGAGGSGNVNAMADIPAAGDLIVTVTGTVTAPTNTSLSNTASVTSSQEVGNPNDNSDTEVTFVGGVDLSLTKHADLALVTPSITGNDHILTYTLTYRNGGFITANGVKIDDLIPANTVFDSAHSSPGWLDATNNPVTNGAAAGTAIHYAVGSLPVSDTGTSITLAVKVNAHVSAGAGTIDNAADISDDGLGGADLTPGDNHATASSTLAAAPDLHLTQMADKLLIIRGQTLHVSYSYTNDGNQDAAGVNIVAHVPTGTTFDAGQSNGGVWMPLGGGDFQLAVGAVPAGGSGTVIFAVDLNTTRVAGLHEVDTTATVADDGNNGPDPTPANNTAASSATKIYEGIYVVSQGIAVPGKAGLPTIRVFDPIDGHELYHFNAYELSYRASVRVAVADINGDGFDDIITTSNLGTGRLRVFDGLTGQWLHDENSYNGPFKNEIAVFDGKKDKGAFVAAGDLTGDGHAEIVVGSALGGSKVRVFDGVTGAAKTFGGSDTFFQPFGKTFKGGVRVAVGDVLGDSRADLAVAMGFYGAEVKVYDGLNLFGFRGDLAALAAPVAPPQPVAAIDFKVGPKTYRGGLSIGLGDLDGDGKLDIITGRNWLKPTLVETFSGLLKDPNGNPRMLGEAIDPFDVNPAKPKYALGVRVAAIDVDFDGIVDIIAASGGNNKSTVNIYSGADHHLIRTFTGLPGTPNSALFAAGTAVSPVARQT